MDTAPYLDKLDEKKIEKLRDQDPEEYKRIQNLQSNGFTFITRVRFHGNELLTSDHFHENFAKKLQFPKFYGGNMDAWIDVMDDMMTIQFPMAKCCVAGGETLEIVITESKKFRESSMYRELVDCVNFINEERTRYEYLKLIFE